MSTAVFVLIVAFPVLAGVVFGVLHAVARRNGLVQAVLQYNVVIYAALLLPVVAVAVAASGHLRWAEVIVGPFVMDVRDRVGGLAAVGAGALAVGIGGLLGGLLYLTERRVWGALRPRPAIGADTALEEHSLADALAEAPSDTSFLTEGRTAQVVRGAASLPLPLLVATTAVIVVWEEVLWRAYLIETAQHWGWPVVAAVAASAAAFGLNHLYFGLQNALAKIVEGVAWAALFLTGGLLAAVASHLVFNLLAFNVRVEIVR